MALFISKAFLLSLTAVGATSAVVPKLDIPVSSTANAPLGARAADPLGGVVLQLVSKKGGPPIRLTTTADGRLPAGEYKLSLSWDDLVRTASKLKSAHVGGGAGTGKVSVQEFTFTMNFDCCPGDLNGDGTAGRRQHKPIYLTKELSEHVFKIEIDGMISGQLLATAKTGK